MAYDPNVIDSFARALQETGASPRVRKALFLAGIQESGLRNLDYGDRDSLGALQQRPSQGWKNARDPYRGALDFLGQAIELNASGRYRSAGQLAQAVQRSAFPDRYDVHSSEANQILAGLGLRPGASPASSPGSTTQSAAGASSTPAAQGIIGSGSAGDVTGLLSSLLGSRERQAPASMPLQAPAFAASPVMPQTFAPLAQTSVPQPQQESAVSQQLGLLDALRGEDPTVTAPDGSEAAAGDSAAPIAQTVYQQRQNGQAGSGRYPLGAPGKVIGVPNSGTHTLGNWQSDNAVDISVPEGTPMIALQDGVVVKVRHHPQDGGRFAGDQITIRGANGNEYFYAHGVANVRPGQRITRGQSLGVTGSANGVAHLHFGQMRGDPRDHV